MALDGLLRDIELLADLAAGQAVADLGEDMGGRQRQRDACRGGAVFLYDCPPDSPVGHSRVEAQTALRQLLDAAKAAGDLRDDIDEHDIMLLLKANDGALRWAADPAEESGRFVEWFLRAWRA